MPSHDDHRFTPTERPEWLPDGVQAQHWCEFWRAFSTEAKRRGHPGDELTPGGKIWRRVLAWWLREGGPSHADEGQLSVLVAYLSVASFFVAGCSLVLVLVNEDAAAQWVVYAIMAIAVFGLTIFIMVSRQERDLPKYRTIALAERAFRAVADEDLDDRWVGDLVHSCTCSFCCGVHVTSSNPVVRWVKTRAKPPCDCRQAPVAAREFGRHGEAQ